MLQFSAMRRLQETFRTLSRDERRVKVIVLRLFSPDDSYRLLRVVDTYEPGDKTIVLDLSTRETYEMIFRQVCTLIALVRVYVKVSVYISAHSYVK